MSLSLLQRRTLRKLTIIFSILACSSTICVLVWFLLLGSTRHRPIDGARNHTTVNMHQTTKATKFFIAFSFGDQLTRATESLLTLAAVAKYADRHVVVPFVKNSSFYGTKLDQNTGTLSRYFDLKELNRKLDSYEYGLLTDWEHFQKHCNQRLDVLLVMLYVDKTTNHSIRLSNSQRQLLEETGWTAGLHTLNRFKGFYINQTIYINPEILTSLQQLEDDVLRGSSCVGFRVWRGIGNNRSHFPIPSNKARSPFSIRHEVPFNRDLLRFAHEFATKRLGQNYISVHIRTEWVLHEHGSSMTYLYECLQQLGSRVQVTKEKTGLKKIFLATDFSRFGSKSFTVREAQEKSEILVEYLGRMLGNHETFNPDTVELSDRGSIAIVELSILSAGKKLFLVGGGNFEDWMKNKFEKGGNNIAEKICYRERPEQNT
ncbi:hypothetical protein OS493_025146 [Desmophyllum pertusum]|uniref:O-fucosyltransferase family protein n=1 Tax=Desmophyllum pertusum TaxID=174260 RepID=A0A9X0D8G6_9CNID|nr:hypothetical protein OS493_025146 [Desmophyllum pertusum]